MVRRLSVIGFVFITLLAFSAGSAFAAKNSNHSKIQFNSETNYQGKSPSDPDNNGKGPDRGNGGYDKPGYTGGIDNDRDGNNGCGNDTDREDDNEGWCGLKPHNQNDKDKDKDKDKCEKTCVSDKDHNDCDKSCTKDGDSDHSDRCGKGNKGDNDGGKGGPTTPPVVVTVSNPPSDTPTQGKVLGISTLPNTATKSVPNYDLLVVWLLVVSGVELHLLASWLKTRKA